jgi:hypothetical protein
MHITRARYLTMKAVTSGTVAGGGASLPCVRRTVDLAMSDIEHEFVIDNEALRAELRHTREIAERALSAAKDAQDAATGHHDPWFDEALQALGRGRVTPAASA